jgi:hypothetical protein
MDPSHLFRLQLAHAVLVADAVFDRTLDTVWAGFAHNLEHSMILLVVVAFVEVAVGAGAEEEIHARARSAFE